MRILALEFSSARRSAAVLAAASEGLAESADSSEGTGAFALIKEALSKARIDRGTIQCIAVGLGPGSYTGIRVAISIAQGWQLATGVKLVGVKSADAVAERARDQGLTGHATCVIDAQRNEFYVCVYDLGATPARVVQPLRIETAAQVSERTSRGEVLIGPERELKNSRLVFPDARVVARLAAHRTDFVPGEELEPVYLRETVFVKAPPPRFSSVAT